MENNSSGTRTRRLDFIQRRPQVEPLGPDCQFPSNLKRIREEQGLSVDELAQKLRLRVGLICDWEDDEAEPTLQQLVTLAYVLGVSTDELLVGRA